MRIALCQLNPTVGDLDGNAQKVVEWGRAAARAGADLVLYPEQVLCGYPADDLLLKRHFLERCGEVLVETAAQLEVPSLVGYPELAEDLYNACAVVVDGKVRASYRKQHLPNYGVFDEHRYFRQGSEPSLLRVGQALVGITVCEDIWLASGPANAEAAAGAHVIVNLSASPYRIGRGGDRERMLATRAADTLSWVVLCNQVCGQDELVFDGHSLVVDHEGQVIARAAQFEEELLVCDLDLEEVVAARLQDTRHRALGRGSETLPVLATIPPRMGDAPEPAPAPAGIPLRHNALAPLLASDGSIEPEVWAALQLGLRDYVDKNGFRDVVLGLSGGIDSALVLALAVDALGAARVRAVTMPSRYSSEGTRGDAEEMAGRLEVELLTLPIEPLMQAYVATLEEPFADREPDITEENLQARIRGNLLMALSNKFGHLVLTTGNKSEVSVGYMTLYGDMAGGFAPIKDVPKTLVYRLARWRNEVAAADGEDPVIPPSTIERPPSAELRSDQKDTDSLPDYEQLDALLEGYVEHDRGLRELVEDGFPEELAARVLRMVDRAEYKRRQAPPGIRISAKAFGRDRRMPITNHFVDGR